MDIDLSSAKSVADVLKIINASSAGVTAALSDTGRGISITDNSGGRESVIIGQSGGASLAADQYV